MQQEIIYSKWTPKQTLDDAIYATLITQPIWIFHLYFALKVAKLHFFILEQKKLESFKKGIEKKVFLRRQKKDLSPNLLKIPGFSSIPIKKVRKNPCNLANRWCISVSKAKVTIVLPLLRDAFHAYFSCIRQVLVSGKFRSCSACSYLMYSLILSEIYPLFWWGLCPFFCVCRSKITK